MHLPIPRVFKLPRFSEGGQGSEVERLMLADQFALHLPREANRVGPPQKCGRAACRLREQLGGPVVGGPVTGEQDGRLTLSRDCKREEPDGEGTVEVVKQILDRSKPSSHRLSLYHHHTSPAISILPNNYHQSPWLHNPHLLSLL